MIANAIEVLQEDMDRLEELEEQLTNPPMRRPRRPRSKDWFKVLFPECG